jgi:hypothetical protein
MFIQKIKYLILFYVIGDLATTIYAINNGLAYEGNPLMAPLVDYSIYLAPLAAKIFIIGLLYACYIYTTNEPVTKLGKKTYTTKSFFNGAVVIITVIGILVTLNNIMVIFDIL